MVQGSGVLLYVPRYSSQARHRGSSQQAPKPAWQSSGPTAQPDSIDGTSPDCNPHPHLSHGDGPEMNGSNPSLKRLQGLYLAAAVLRLVLFFAFPGLPELVAGRVEVSTPVTSFKRCMPPLLLLGRPHGSVRADHCHSTRGSLPL